MRALDVLIAMNDRAAGREAGHADNDGDDRKASAIHAAVYVTTTDNEDFATGYLRGRKDD